MSKRSSGKLSLFAVLLVCAAAVLWWQREPLTTWYYIQRLKGADAQNRMGRAESVAQLEALAVPSLFEMLTSSDASHCANAEAALAALARRWGLADSRTSGLGEDIVLRFTNFSAPGQEAVLEWFMAVLQESRTQKMASGGWVSAAHKLLPKAVRVPANGVRMRTLALAEVMLAAGERSHVELSRELALAGMEHADANVRGRAVQLVMQPPLHKETALLARAVPLLKDVSPEVRRAAVLSLGLAEEAVSVEAMLPLLHDSDAEVRRLCEVALRGRGLGDNHVKLARLISDEHPMRRLQVVRHMNVADDLDPAVWLIHLSHDTSPAVRAAAIRFAAAGPLAIEFHQRLLQMSRDDPSLTVRQLAEYYLTRLRGKN